MRDYGRRDLDSPLANAHGALPDGPSRVFELLAYGLTNQQISERLYLSPKTVKNYVSEAFGKLGLANRTQAALVAAECMRAPCGHCGTTPIHGFAAIHGVPVCHATTPSYLDCYRLVVVHGERLGSRIACSVSDKQANAKDSDTALLPGAAVTASGRRSRVSTLARRARNRVAPRGERRG